MSAAIKISTARVTAAYHAFPGTRGRSTKSGKAQVITKEMLDYLLQQVAVTSKDPLRDYTILLLSFKAGLRAGEIAGLNWGDVTDPLGRIGKPVRNRVTGEIEFFFDIPNAIAKKKHGRALPMHAIVRTALEHLRQSYGPDRCRRHDPVIRSLTRPETRVSPNTLVKYLISIYERAGLQGCSSHSGRRTAITELAQTANMHGCSLKDVQAFAGHAYIDTTEAYVEQSPHFGRLVRSL